MKQDIYVEQYRFEWEHRAYLLPATNLSIVLATVVAGESIAISLLYEFSNSAPSYVTATLLAFSFAALAFAAYSILRPLSGYEYVRVPMPSA